MYLLQFFVWIVLTLTSFSCRHLKDFGRAAQSAAPAASIVILDQSYTTVLDTAYTKEQRISMTVKRGLINSLAIAYDGQLIERLDRAESREIVRRNENNIPYYFSRDIDADNKTMELTQIIDIYPGLLRENDKKVIELTETSANTSYKGTSREKVSKKINIVYIQKPPIITEMSAPSLIRSGETVKVSWSVKHAKKVELFHYGVIVQNKEPASPMSDLSDSFSVRIDANDKGLYHPAFHLKAQNIYGETAEAKHRVDFFVINDCASGSSRRSFQFCITCKAVSVTPLPLISGDQTLATPDPIPQPPYTYDHTVSACDSTEARSTVQQQWGRCEIKEGVCN